MDKNRTRRAVGQKIAALLLLLGIVVSCTGCRGESSLGSRLFAEAVGVDASANGVTLTLLGEVADNGEDSGAYMTGQGVTITDALARITGQTGRAPYFPHNRALIVGTDTAQTGMEGILRFFTEYTGCRVGVPLLLAEGSASELMASLKQSGVDPQYLVRLTDPETMAGQTVRTPLYTVMTEDGIGDFAAPILQAGKDGVTVTGTALFHQGKMTGRLTPEETVGLHLIRGTLTYALVYLELPEGRASVAITVDALHPEVRDGQLQVAGELHGVLFESEFGVAAGNRGGVYTQLAQGCVRQLTEWGRTAAEKLRQAGAEVPELAGWTGNSAIRIDLELEIRPTTGN